MDFDKLLKIFHDAAELALHRYKFCLCGLVFLSFIFKLLLYRLEPSIGRDASLYCHLAQEWNNNGEFNHLWIPPLLIFLMKCGTSIGISVQTAGQAVNMIAGSLCTLIGYGITSEVTENKKAALIAAALFAVHPGINNLSIEIQRDALYLFLAGTAMWSALAGLKRKNFLFWIISGIFCALAALTRFETFEFLPIAAGVLFAAAISRQISWKQACLYIFGFYAFTAVTFCVSIWGMGTTQVFNRYSNYFTGKLIFAQKQFFNPQNGVRK